MQVSKKLTELKAGWKTISRPEVILVVMIYATNQFGNDMMTGYQSILATQYLGIDAKYVGLSLTMFMFAGMLISIPAGYIGDNMNPKMALIGCFIAKIGVNVLFGLIPRGEVWMYLVVRFLHGVVWALVNILAIGFLGVSVDRRAAGTAYALLMTMSALVSVMGRPLALYLLENHGGTYVAFLTAIVTVVPVVLTGLLRTDVIGEAEQSHSEPKISRKETSLLRQCFLVSMVPLSLVSAIPMMGFNLETNYLPHLAAEFNADYIGALTAASIISSVTCFISGILCDIISPVSLLIVTTGLNAAGLFVMGNGNVSVGLLLYYIGYAQVQLFPILGMKCVDRNQQNSFQGTMHFIKDVGNMIWGIALGSMVTSLGYSSTFRITGVIVASAIVFLIFCKKYSLDKIMLETRGKK